MDNARYHNAYPPDSPVVNKIKVRELADAFQKYGITVEQGLTSLELKKILRKHVADNVKPESVQLEETVGHKVLFTPPHFSNL